MHQERTNKHANDDAVPDGAVPAYLLDREGVSRAKVLSNTVKQKRKEKAGKWDVPIPKVFASQKPLLDDVVLASGLNFLQARYFVSTPCLRSPAEITGGRLRTYEVVGVYAGTHTRLFFSDRSRPCSVSEGTFT